ncbi:transposase IS4 family protein [Streptomyces sp. 769]|nr:transposase IS4 family protein [Streptomyces sp. 769]
MSSRISEQIRRHRPDVLLGDRGYDHDKYRRLIWYLGVQPMIAHRGTQHGSGQGSQRCLVERALVHLHWFRRPRIRWEIHDDTHQAFLTLTLGCSIIC